MANSTYMNNILLDYKFGNQSPPSIPTRYFAIMTTMPSPSGGGVEVSGGSYARVSKTNNLTNFPAASGGTKNNAIEIDFGTPTADWAPVSTPALGIACYDAASGGNLLDYGLFTNPAVILNGVPFKINIGGGTFEVI